MLLGKDRDWSTYYLSILVPENVISDALITLHLIEKYFRDPTPEQELFVVNYSKYYIDREPGSIESLRITDNPDFTKWYNYFKRKTKFSFIKYKILALDFYTKNPLFKETKQLLTAIYMQIPSEDPFAYKRLLGLKNTSSRIYLKHHLRLLKSRNRFLYSSLDYKKEANIYLSLSNALDSI